MSEMIIENRILVGDAAQELKKLESESVDLVVTDPPYGLGFMGKDWDRAVPHVDVWRECLRVLKSGAFAFIMCSPRFDCLTKMGSNLQEAGFNVGFTPIYWAYASGFPKAMNVGKAVDKKLGFERDKHEEFRTDIKGARSHSERDDSSRSMIEITSNNAISEQAKALDGSYGGFQPKPAVEVIIVAMKSLSERTYVDQALKNKHGVTWLDEGHISFQSDSDLHESERPNVFGKEYKATWYKKESTLINNPQGRFPANLCCSSAIDVNLEALLEAKRLLK